MGTKARTMVACWAGACLMAQAVSAQAPSYLTIDEQRLSLVGRYTYKFLGFYRIFSIGLYGEGEKAADGFFETEPASLRFEYNMGFSADQIVKRGEEALRAEFSASERARFSDSLERLNAAYVDVKKGDEYRLDFAPEDGLTLRHNGAALVTVETEGFAAFYTRIWLGEREECEDIRQSLLP